MIIRYYWILTNCKIFGDADYVFTFPISVDNFVEIKMETWIKFVDLPGGEWQ